jgi:hypothetical protein
MKADHSLPAGSQGATGALVSELLILPDGRVLIHNLTPVLAEILKRLGLCDEELAGRFAAQRPHTRSRHYRATIDSTPV